jgi:hypothetical protein
MRKAADGGQVPQDGNALPKWMDLIDASFLNNDFKKQYKSIIQERFKRLM